MLVQGGPIDSVVREAYLSFVDLPLPHEILPDVFGNGDDARRASRCAPRFPRTRDILQSLAQRIAAKRDRERLHIPHHRDNGHGSERDMPRCRHEHDVRRERGDVVDERCISSTRVARIP